MTTALILPVALGGALGAVSRLLASGAIMHRMGANFPYGTMAVNVLGSLAIGAVAGWFLREGVEAKPTLQAFLITGFLGGFTTFSAFSLDAYTLLQRGDTQTALIYAVASVVLTIAACALGIWLVKAA